MFGFGKNKQAEQTTSTLLSRIKKDTSKEIKISSYEMEFFIALEKELKNNNLNADYFRTHRLSNGSIRFNCPAGDIGVVHLRKRFGSIMYYTSVYDSHDMDDAPIEAVIAVIPYWIAYTKKMIRAENTIMSGK